MPISSETPRPYLSGPGHRPNPGYSFLFPFPLSLFFLSYFWTEFPHPFCPPCSLAPPPALSPITVPIPSFRWLSFPGPLSSHFLSSFVLSANFSLFPDSGVPMNPARFPFSRSTPAPVQRHATNSAVSISIRQVPSLIRPCFARENRDGNRQ